VTCNFDIHIHTYLDVYINIPERLSLIHTFLSIEDSSFNLNVFFCLLLMFLHLNHMEQVTILILSFRFLSLISPSFGFLHPLEALETLLSSMCNCFLEIIWILDNHFITILQDQKISVRFPWLKGKLSEKSRVFFFCFDLNNKRLRVI